MPMRLSRRSNPRSGARRLSLRRTVRPNASYLRWYSATARWRECDFRCAWGCRRWRNRCRGRVRRWVDRSRRRDNAARCSWVALPDAERYSAAWWAHRSIQCRDTRPQCFLPAGWESGRAVQQSTPDPRATDRQSWAAQRDGGPTCAADRYNADARAVDRARDRRPSRAPSHRRFHTPSRAGRVLLRADWEHCLRVRDDMEKRNVAPPGCAFPWALPVRPRDFPRRRKHSRAVRAYERPCPSIPHNVPPPRRLHRGGSGAWAQSSRRKASSGFVARSRVWRWRSDTLHQSGARDTNTKPRWTARWLPADRDRDRYAPRATIH